MEELADRLAALIADYREGEIQRPDRAHVLCWINQFDQADQSVVLSETLHILSKFYINKANCGNFIRAIASSEKLAGADPNAFWRSTEMLRLQTRSQSQKDILDLMLPIVGELYGIGAFARESSNNSYLYVDDVFYSAGQVQRELENWIMTTGPQNAKVHILAMGRHDKGRWFAEKKLKEVASAKAVQLTWYSSRVLRLSDWRNVTNRDKTDVLWPSAIPDDHYVQQWLANNPNDAHYATQENCRPGTVPHAPFSSADSRHVLEQAYLKKGAFICSLPRNPDKRMKPLGYHRLGGWGFGTFLMTYRNCPNNAPLVLWWGDPNAGQPLNQWYPLLPRRVRAENLAEWPDVD